MRKPDPLLTSNPAPRPRRSLLRQAGSTSAIAMLAVLAGFLLDVVIAATYGAGPITDAFFVSARIPLGIWALAVAAANQALVPAFSTSLNKHGEAATWRDSSHMAIDGAAESTSPTPAISVIVNSG